MKTSRFLLSHAALLFLALGGAVRGQSDEDFFPELGLLTTVGTTAAAGDGHLAYLLWQTGDAGLLMNKVVAVYRKTGAGSFVRVAVTKPQTDPRIIGSLQARAVALGDSMDRLERGLTVMFKEVIPAETLTLPAKISAIIQGTQNRADLREMLGFLARSHPLVSMSLGQAVADKLPSAGVFTYEIREHDAISHQDIRVLGRVTVDTAAGATLPAPGAPVEVVPAGAKIREGHLAAHLRWATPPELRERSSMHSGFNVYRVPQAVAEHASRQWHLAPPAAATLREASAEVAMKVNNSLITPERVLDDTLALDENDHDTYFVTDDNRRYRDGTAFLDGAAFYYFVTAADILGRDGLVSKGRLITLHDRLAPLPPRDLRVTNEVVYAAGKRTQHLRLHWPPATDPDSSISAYHVYRWNSIEEMAQFRANPAARRIATVPHNPATSEYVVNDSGSGSPRHPPASGQPDVSGTLFFYTVRAVDSSSAGGNMSLHSAPARGILRDSEGPAAPTGEVMIRCHDPLVTYESIKSDPVPGLAPNMYHLQLICGTVAQRTYEWAEFRFGDGQAGATTPLGRVQFGRDGLESQTADLFASVPTWPSSIWCRAATREGKVSPWVRAAVTTPPKTSDVHFNVLFAAALTSHDAVAGGPCGTTHISRIPGSRVRRPVIIGATPTAGAAELRVYRRVDDGPLTLMSVQELADGATPVVVQDDAVPAGSAQVCYYLQLVDVDGHPSPMVPAGPCVRTINDEELPVPRLLRPEPEAGPAGAPRMRLRWACAPHGVERFELWIARRNAAPQGGFPGSGLTNDLATEHPLRLPRRASLDFGVYQTVLASQAQTEDNGAVFTALLPVTASDRYVIGIRAVGPGTFAGGRAAGDHSNFGDFQWNPAEAGGGINVPWSARPLPPTRAAAAFNPNIQAVFLHNLGSGTGPWKGVGIRVGEYEYRGSNASVLKAGNPGVTSTMPAYYLAGQRDPKLLLYRETTPDDTASRLLWPLVLYRVQVGSNNAPLSGDTTQASPLMENIAHEFATHLGDPMTIIHDPFIAVTPRAGPPPSGSTHDIYLLDRNPVIKGAYYKYLLVRMGADSEPEEVLATLPVNIPLNP